jgi:hypothetical protein
MSKKPMSMETVMKQDVCDATASIDALPESNGLPSVEGASVTDDEPARARPSPAEEFVAWVAGLEWAAAYSDSVTRLLEEVQKRARRLL